MSSDSSVESLRRQQRLILRCVTTFLLDVMERQIRRHQGDFTRAVVYMAAIQASRPPAIKGAADEPVRTFSVRAIAQSMGLAYETTRRNIAELEAAGLARRVDRRGLTVAPSVFEAEAYRADCEATWRALRRLIIDLHALGFEFGHLPGGPSLASVRRPTCADLVDGVAVLVNDFLLRVLEIGADPHGSMLDASIFSTMMLANAELLTNDPRLAWVYAGAETPPPDDLRKPTTITGVAQALGLSHETVRRRIRHYQERGWVKRVTGGYLITVERLQDPVILGTGLMISQRFLQLMQSVRSLGIEPDEIMADAAPA